MILCRGLTNGSKPVKCHESTTNIDMGMKRHSRINVSAYNGGHSWDRTNDLPIKSRLLYQLSYVPEKQEKNEGSEQKPVTPRNDW